MTFTSPWPHLDIPKCNILSYLFPQAVTPSDQPVWINASNPSDSLSPAQMLSWIKRFAVGLDRLGVAEREVILVLSPNQIPVSIVYLAAAGSKRCFTGVNPIYTVSEVAHQMKAIQAAVVLVHPALLKTGMAAAKLANVPADRIFSFSNVEDRTAASQGVRDWLSILASEGDADSWQWDPLHGDEAAQTTAVVNFSSGTTGLPKGVCITHYNLVANSAQAIINESHGKQHQTEEKWLAFLPLYHAYSQLFTINIACKLQAKVYIMPKFVFEDFLRHIEKFKITTIQLVPPIVVMMAKRPETARYNLRSVKSMVSGAAPLSSDLQNEFINRFGVKLRQAFGMSETTCAGIMTPRGAKNIVGSIGCLLPNTEARLIGEDGEEIIKDNQPGELCLRGPQIMSEYWRNKEATRDSLHDGWLKTGDVALVREGRWWIVDRKKELIKVNGLQVAPAELEAVLLEHPDVTDAAVVGMMIHDEESPRAYVVLSERSKGKIKAADIQDFVAGKVAKHKQLSGGVQFIDEVPKLASGKIVRKVLKEWAKRDAKAIGSTVKARL
ncbi:hypothetical protein H2204_005777 [Knufia peltigerae]|uniref:4-coumarate--CoA ligase n=1 Tax=Knufia peltigerae TaxID=1002370 RepID=A0AA39CZM1_9EURO|nr:hypothetical protein H2204_005777 [Knufia peltigerae]